MEAGMAGHRAKPALRPKQGKRMTYIVSLPIGELLDMLTIAPGGEDNVETANREITDSWVSSIERGLRRKLAAGIDRH